MERGQEQGEDAKTRYSKVQAKSGQIFEAERKDQSHVKESQKIQSACDVVVVIGCGCVVTSVSYGQLAVKWSLNDHATHRCWVCQKKKLQFRSVEAPPPRCTWCEDPEIGSFPQISIMTPCNPMGRVSYMQVWLGLAWLGLWFGGFSFVRKLQQTSRLMMQTSSFYLASRFDYGYLIVCMDTIQKKAIKHCRKHFHLMPRSMHYCPFQLILEFLIV